MKFFGYNNYSEFKKNENHWLNVGNSLRAVMGYPEVDEEGYITLTVNGVDEKFKLIEEKQDGIIIKDSTGQKIYYKF